MFCGAVFKHIFRLFVLFSRINLSLLQIWKCLNMGYESFLKSIIKWK